MKKNIRLYNWKMEDTGRDLLRRYKFHYSSVFSNSESSYYTLDFPVVRYKGSTIMEAHLILERESGFVEIHVTDMCGHPYAAWYSDTYCTDNKVVDEVNSEIIKKLRKLGIKKWKS